MAATYAHVPTVSTVRQELADAEAKVRDMQEALAAAKEEANQAHRAGAAVLSALEAAMAPLMAELAAERRHCANLDAIDMPEAFGGEEHAGVATIGDMEAEVKHLQLDISHYQEKVERLHIEERQRSHELRRLRVELSDAQENLNYEQQRLRHLESCKQHGFDSAEEWAGLGPSGIGRRTMEVRAEKKMRESAEQRAGRLNRDVTKLASDAAAQQAEIAMLSKRLHRARQISQDKQRHFEKVAAHSDFLNKKMDAAARGAARMFEKTSGASRKSGESIEDGQDDRDGQVGLADDFNIHKPGFGQGFSRKKIGALTSAKKKVNGTSSTGKLPQLSF